MSEKVDIKQEIKKLLMNLHKRSKNKKMKKTEIITDLKDKNLLEEDNFILFQCLK